MGFLAGEYILFIPRLLLRVALLLMFVKNKAVWLVLRCAGLAGGFEPQTSSWQDCSEKEECAASAEIIRELLPVTTFGDFVQRPCESEEEFVCAVCLSAFEEDDEIRELRNCCHIFHRNCLDKWLDHDQNTCPLCRSSLLPEVFDREYGCEELSWAVDRISYLFAEDLMVA